MGACELPASLPGVTTPAQQLALFTGGGGGGGGPSSYSIDNQLTNDPTYNVISLEAYKVGAFAGGFHTAFPVTIQLTGNELDSATCGACVLGFGGVHNSSWTGSYFATGGTVVLTALSKTRIAGKLKNITLTHISYGAEHTTPLNDGCNTTVEELDFDAVPSMSFTSPGLLRFPWR